MELDVLWDVAWKVGLPFVMVLTALFSGKAGVWVWAREIEQERLRAERDLQSKNREIEAVTKDRDYFRDIAFEALNRAEGVVKTAEQAVGLAEQRGGRRGYRP